MRSPSVAWRYLGHTAGPSRRPGHSPWLLALVFPPRLGNGISKPSRNCAGGDVALKIKPTEMTGFG